MHLIEQNICDLGLHFIPPAFIIAILFLELPPLMPTSVPGYPAQ